MPHFSQLDTASKLCYAANQGNVTKLKEVLATPEAREKINQPVGPFGHSAIFFACFGSASAEVVQILIAAGANPFQRDSRGRLPLHFAANALAADVLRILLAVANMVAHKLDATSEFGVTPIHALFLPGPTKDARLQACLTVMLNEKTYGETALRTKDHNALTPLILVKHFGLTEALAAQAGEQEKRLLRNYISRVLKLPPGIGGTLAHPVYDYAADKFVKAVFAEDVVMDLVPPAPAPSFFALWATFQVATPAPAAAAAVTEGAGSAAPTI